MLITFVSVRLEGVLKESVGMGLVKCRFWEFCGISDTGFLTEKLGEGCRGVYKLKVV